MSAKQNGDLNNLNMSVHGAINGEVNHESVNNIPFADDVETAKVHNTNEKSSDSISSNESYSEKSKFNSSRRTPVKFAYKNTTGNEASDESDSDDCQLTSEKRDKPGPLASELSRAAEPSNLGVMRRNSISMPVLNEMDLDQLRNLHMKACESSDTMDDSRESLEKITVSLMQKVLMKRIIIFRRQIEDVKKIKFSWLIILYQ